MFDHVKGVGNEQLLCEGKGTLIGAFEGVPALYVPGLKASIISEDAIEDHCHIKASPKKG